MSWVPIEEVCQPLMDKQLAKKGEKALPAAYAAALAARQGGGGGGGSHSPTNTALGGGDTDDDDSGELSGAVQRAERRLQLADYYLALLNLFGEMALDRSYNCIGALQEQFTYEMVVTCMMNKHLPDIVRAAFTVLCTRLFVDRFPQFRLLLPNLVREAPGKVFLDVDKYLGA